MVIIFFYQTKFKLESPESGGATVFPTIGAYVPPIRRSAVFWYNLRKNGDPDKRTLHAACPVINKNTEKNLTGDKYT